MRTHTLFKKINTVIILLFFFISSCLVMPRYAEAAGVTFSVNWPSESSINATSVTLTGVRQANMNILINGTQVIASSNPFSTGLLEWEYAVALPVEGDNSIFVQSQESIFKIIAAEDTHVIIRDTTAPIKPQVLNVSSQKNNATTYDLVGKKEAGSGIIINEKEVVPASSSTVWQASVSLTKEGNNSFTIRAQDTAYPPNQSAFVTVTLYRDTTPPQKPSVTNMPSSDVEDATYTLQGTKDAYASMWINNKKVVSETASTSWSHSVSLAEGSNTFTLISRDDAVPSNESDSVDVTIVRKKGEIPAPTITWPTYAVNSTDYLLKGTKPAGTSLWINDVQKVTANASTTWQKYVTLATDGTQSFTVHVRDANGDKSASVEGAITRDMTAPAQPGITVWPSSPVSTNMYTLHGTKEAGSAILINSAEVVSPTAGTYWSYDVSLSEGANTFRVVACDTAVPSNKSSASMGVITRKTGAVAIPTASFPVLAINSSIYALQGTKQAYSSIWINGVEQVPYSTATTWQINVPLSAEGENVFAIQARDNAAPANTSDTMHGTIMRDMIAPSQPFVDNWPTGTVTVNTYELTGDKDAGTSVWINNEEVIPVNNSTRWSYTVSLAEGDNLISVTVKDNAVPANESPQIFSHIIKTTKEVSAPYVRWPSSCINGVTYTLTGTKERNASIWINGAQAVGATDSRTWEASVSLTQEGANAFSVTARDTDIPVHESGTVTGAIMRDMTAPSRPVITNWPSGSVLFDSYTLQGTKDAGASVWVNGIAVGAADNATTWQYAISLVGGINNVRISCTDIAVPPNTSIVVTGSIEYDSNKPSAPTAIVPTYAVNGYSYELQGAKDAGTSVWINGIQKIAINNETAWSQTVLLSEEGDNAFSVITKKANMIASDPVSVVIVRDTTPPIVPDVTNWPVGTITTDTYILHGIKEPYASVILNGETISEPDAETTWNAEVSLASGNNSFAIMSKDIAVPPNISAVVRGTITYDTAKPSVPVCVAPAYPINGMSYELHGTKDAHAGIWINGVERIAVDDQTEWTVSVSLSVEGNNVFSCEARKTNGIASDILTLIIVRDMTPPAEPSVTNWPDGTVNSVTYTLQGAKEEHTSVWINGTEIIPLNDATTWSYPVNLSEGNNTFSVTSKDAAVPANASAVVNGTIVCHVVVNKPNLPTVVAPDYVVNGYSYDLHGTKDADTSIWINGIQKDVVTSETSWCITVVLSSEGSNTFSVVSKKANGIASDAVDIVIVRDTTAPEIPVVANWPTETVSTSTYTLIGIKDAHTSIWISGEEAVSMNDAATWQYTVSLDVGSNSFTVVAQDAAVPANTSASVSGTIVYDANANVPDAPTGLVVSQDDMHVILQWTDESDNETGFMIERAVAGGSFAEYAAVAVNTTTYTDTDVQSGQTYAYRISAFNGDDVSAPTASASITIGSLVPQAPGSLAVQQQDAYVHISWLDQSDDETGFRIYRRISGDPALQEIATVAADTSTYDDTAVDAGTTYEYTVSAYNTYGESTIPMSVTITVTETSTVPVSPAGLTVQQSDNTVILAWQDMSDDETGFTVYRKLGTDQTFTSYATLAAGQTGYTDASVTAGETYIYEVKAFNAYGASASSNSVTITVTQVVTSTVPYAVTALQSGSSVALFWQYDGPQASGFRVFRRSSIDSTYAQYATAAGSARNYTDSSVSEGNRYSYYIVADTAQGASDASAVASIFIVQGNTDLLDRMHAKAVKYALQHAYVNGLIYDISYESQKASTASTGFGLGALVSAHMRAGTSSYWTMSHDDVMTQVRSIVTTLREIQTKQAGQESVYGTHGFFFHFMDGNGRRFNDSELSVVDNTLLIAGLYLAQEYFSFDTTIVTTIDAIFDAMDWSFFYAGGDAPFYHKWTPEAQFDSTRTIYDYLNSDELLLIALIAYMQNSDDADYKKILFNWPRLKRSYSGFDVYNTFYGSLFSYFFAHCFFDFDALGYDTPAVVQAAVDAVHWGENSKYAALANRQFCMNNRNLYSSYGVNSWGLSACLRPDGSYYGSSGARPCQSNSGAGMHDGTVTTTAAVSCMPILREPGELLADNPGMQVLEHVYGMFGENAFDYSAYNHLGEHTARMVGIEILPAAMMLENYRTGHIWDVMMRIAEAVQVTDEWFEKKPVEPVYANNFIIEAEEHIDHSGGVLDYKSEASEGKCWGGGWGKGFYSSDFVSYELFFHETTDLLASLRYSDDVGGSMVIVYVDGEERGSWTTVDSDLASMNMSVSDPVLKSALDWEDYVWTSPTHLGTITRGLHTIQLKTTFSSWGVNLDQIMFRDAFLSPITIKNITPPDGSGVTLGDGLAIVVAAEDPNGSVNDLQYQFTVDSTIAQSWSSDNTFSVSNSVSERGICSVFVEVKDVMDNRISEIAEYYFYRAPIAPPDIGALTEKSATVVQAVAGVPKIPVQETITHSSQSDNTYAAGVQEPASESADPQSVESISFFRRIAWGLMRLFKTQRGAL